MFYCVILRLGLVLGREAERGQGHLTRSCEGIDSNENKSGLNDDWTDGIVYINVAPSVIHNPRT